MPVPWTRTIRLLAALATQSFHLMDKLWLMGIKVCSCIPFQRDRVNSLLKTRLMILGEDSSSRANFIRPSVTHLMEQSYLSHLVTMRAHPLQFIILPPKHWCDLREGKVRSSAVMTLNGQLTVQAFMQPVPVLAYLAPGYGK